MSEEAKKTLTDWLTKMANQSNQCLQNLVEIDGRKPQEESANQENNANHSFSKTTVNKIEYYHIERFYDDDDISDDMKSGKVSTKAFII